MSVQLVAVRHAQSGIQQVISLERDRATDRPVWIFQATSAGNTFQAEKTKAEVLECLRVWRDLAEAGELKCFQRDALTMKAHFDCAELWEIHGVAPSIEEEFPR